MNWLAITFAGCTPICIVWFFLEGHFVTWWRIRKEDQVNFDMERMVEALNSPRHQLPAGLSKEGIRAHLLEHARKTQEIRP